MRSVQRKLAVPASALRPQINDLELTGFTVQPLQLLFACTSLVVGVILLHFFVKLGAKL